MKINISQLESQLVQNKISLLYLMSSEEIFLKNDAINLIRKSAKRAGFHEQTRLIDETGFNWNQLYDLLFSSSLLSEKRFIEINFRNHSPPKLATQILEEYLQHPSSNHLLLININKINSQIAKSHWYKLFEKNGTVVQIWPLNREQLPQWVMDRAKKYKMKLDRHQATLIADLSEGNLAAAAQAVEKLYLLKFNQSSSELSVILRDESRFNLFDFIDHLIKGDAKKTLHILEKLRKEGEEPILILWSITRELRLLADYAQQLKEGVNFATLAQKNKIFFKRQSLVQQFLTKFSAEDCWRFILQTSEIDKLLKGVGAGNVWESLQSFCLNLIGTSKKQQSDAW